MTNLRIGLCALVVVTQFISSQCGIGFLEKRHVTHTGHEDPQTELDAAIDAEFGQAKTQPVATEVEQAIDAELGKPVVQPLAAKVDEVKSKLLKAVVTKVKDTKAAEAKAEAAVAQAFAEMEAEKTKVANAKTHFFGLKVKAAATVAAAPVHVETVASQIAATSVKAHVTNGLVEHSLNSLSGNVESSQSQKPTLMKVTYVTKEKVEAKESHKVEAVQGKAVKSEAAQTRDSEEAEDDAFGAEESGDTVEAKTTKDKTIVKDGRHADESEETDEDEEDKPLKADSADEERETALLLQSIDAPKKSLDLISVAKPVIDTINSLPAPEEDTSVQNKREAEETMGVEVEDDSSIHMHDDEHSHDDEHMHEHEEDAQTVYLAEGSGTNDASGESDFEFADLDSDAEGHHDYDEGEHDAADSLSLLQVDEHDAYGHHEEHEDDDQHEEADLEDDYYDHDEDDYHEDEDHTGL